MNENSGARRARWLAELADALDDARHLLKELGAGEGRVEALELYARIEAVRLEVIAMQLRRSCGVRELGPEWTKNVPWRQSA